MIPKLRNALLLILMLAAAGAAVALRPTHKVADRGPKVDLEAMIPRMFEDWNEEKLSSAQIVDPQTQEAVDKVYSQTLTRTYIQSSGERIMLSIAYGGDQSDSLQVHLPEGCYGGQGFAVGEILRGYVQTAFGGIPVSRLVATKGQRIEPITYWIATAGEVSSNSWDMKKAKLAYTLMGKVPDGILIRISSISADTNRAYDLQSQFAAAMIGSMATEDRKRLIGAKGG